MNKLPENEIKRILEAVEHLETIPPSVVEKDIFVTKAIHAVSDIKNNDINLVFCGGTCLAKAYQIVNRMSEDVDFKIYPIVPFTSTANQRKKLKIFKEDMTALLIKAGFEISQHHLISRDNNGYNVYRLDYPSYFDQHQELRPHIQLEFTLAPPRLPTEMKPVRSLVDQVFPEDKGIEKNIDCISVLETAAEKWVALTRRIASIERGHDKIDETLVRHIYDLDAITNNVDLTHDFFILVDDTIDRDRHKFKRHREYYTDAVEEIKYSLKILSHNPLWLKNYDAFIDAMVFDKKKSGFHQSYTKLQYITERVLQHIQQGL